MTCCTTSTPDYGVCTRTLISAASASFDNDELDNSVVSLLVLLLLLLLLFVYVQTTLDGNKYAILHNNVDKKSNGIALFADSDEFDFAQFVSLTYTDDTAFIRLAYILTFLSILPFANNCKNKP